MLDALVEHLVPGRSADARAARDDELRKTLVIRLPIDEASAKIRTGGPIDDEEDLALPIWAGVLPLTLTAGVPIDASDLPTYYQHPDYATPTSARQQV